MFCLVWFGLVWFGLVWFGLVWFSLTWLGLAWLGLVWFGYYRRSEVPGGGPGLDGINGGGEPIPISGS